MLYNLTKTQLIKSCFVNLNSLEINFLIFLSCRTEVLTSSEQIDNFSILSSGEIRLKKLQMIVIY